MMGIIATVAPVATNAQIVSSLVSNVGFPIAMCCGMFAYLRQKDAETKKEIDSLSDAINNNTLVITKLLDKIGGN